MSEIFKNIASLLILTVFVILILLIFIFVIIILYKKNQIKQQRDFEILNLNHEKSLLKTQLEIQEQTFKNISQEIHDNISLSLTLAKLHLNTISFHKDNTARVAILESVDLISKSLNDLNDISKSLDSEMIRSNGLIYALEFEAQLLGKTGKHEVNVVVKGEPEYLESDKELVLFRIVQESCNNILKHSEANEIHIELNYRDDHLLLSVKDNGKGFDETCISEKLLTRPMSGLNNIRNRAKMINAGLQILSKPGEGTIVQINLPFEKIYDSNKN